MVASGQSNWPNRCGELSGRYLHPSGQDTCSERPGTMYGQRINSMVTAGLVVAAILTAVGCGRLPGVSGDGDRPERHPFTVAFGGDVHFEGGLRAKLDADA